ncbi:MAG: 50S ribosomal protein L25 [Patescibacteria group bacterium]|nr:50S ribosomal protein L25 [Patescibacteria group bacterium]
MEKLVLKATTRDLLGKKVKNLRREGQVPLVLYGRKFAAMSISADENEFKKLSHQAGEATLINIEIPGHETAKALIRQIQKDPTTDTIIHADLYKVDMSEEIETEIPLVFDGVALAVEELEGNFITNKDAIKVKCLPDKLISEIKVDISSLKTFEDLIHVKDLDIPEGIKVLEEAEDIIAQVTAPLSEEELEKIESGEAATGEKEQIENMEAQAEIEKAEKEAEGAAEEQTEGQPTQNKNEG